MTQKTFKIAIYLLFLFCLQQINAQRFDPDSVRHPQLKGWPKRGYNNFRVVDIDNDNINEIFFYKSTQLATIVLTCRKPDGSLKENWTDVKTRSWSSDLLFYDIDKDGIKEIIVQNYRDEFGTLCDFCVFDSHGNKLNNIIKTNSSFDNISFSNYCLIDVLSETPGPELVNADENKVQVFSTNNIISKMFEYKLPYFGNHFPYIHFLSGGDLDKNGVSEIVGIYAEAGEVDYTTYLFHIEPEMPQNGFWMVEIDAYFPSDCKIVLGDINNDGFSEIIVSEQNVFIYDYLGNLKNTIAADNSVDAIALADLDKDQKLEIIYATNYSVNVLKYDGSNYKNWPQKVDGSFSNIVIGDIDGTDSQEIIVEKEGALFIWHENGEFMYGYSKGIRIIPQNGQLFLCDLDSDGDIDLLSLRADIIYAFDFYKNYNKFNIDWPMENHDLYLTSMYGFKEMNNKDPKKNDFYLWQNYPNPFNSSTTIEYTITEPKFVTIKVYDIIGKEVATLVNENKYIGNYTVDFNASNLSSGVYFYSLKAGLFLDTKKLILIK